MNEFFDDDALSLVRNVANQDNLEKVQGIAQEKLTDFIEETRKSAFLKP